MVMLCAVSLRFNVVSDEMLGSVSDKGSPEDRELLVSFQATEGAGHRELSSGSRLTFESQRGFPSRLYACEFGACAPEFPSLSCDVIPADLSIPRAPSTPGDDVGVVQRGGSIAPRARSY